MIYPCDIPLNVVATEVENALTRHPISDARLDDIETFVTYTAKRLAHERNEFEVKQRFYRKALDFEPSDGIEPTKGPIDRFLDDLYGLDSTSNTARSVDLVFATMHFWLARGGLEVCDAILDKVDVTKLKTDTILSFLGITFSARQKLRRRKAYYERAKRAVRKDQGWILAHRLLSPLK